MMLVVTLLLAIGASGTAADPQSPSNADREPGSWIVRGGTTSLVFDAEVLAGLGWRSAADSVSAVAAAEGPVVLTMSIDEISSLAVQTVGPALGDWQASGAIRHIDAQIAGWPAVRQVLGSLIIRPAGLEDRALWLADTRVPDATLELRRVKAGIDPVARTFTVRSPEVRISAVLARHLGKPNMAGATIGSILIQAEVHWVGQDEPPTPDFEAPAYASESGGPVGGDMTFCELFGLYMPTGARLGDVVGVTVATTSWNIGDADLMWFPIPAEEHPFIVMNLFRLRDDRFEQIGQSHIKHGFFALDSHQCGGPPCTFEDGHGFGNWLGAGCTDTYSASLNAVQTGMGPRYEVNPWTAEWSYPDSHMATLPHAHDAIQHRLQVHDDDLDPAQNAGATYYVEGYYAIGDDVNNTNNAAWKPVAVSGAPGGTWTFSMSGPLEFPNIGYAPNAWPGAQITVLAEEIPVVEFESPDGRCLLAAKATDLGDGVYHYEYALYNVDMDRQVGSFAIPVSSNVAVSDIGFHAVRHHDEPLNSPGGVPIDNAAWAANVLINRVEWFTSTNPLRWGTMYNFRFNATAPPAPTTVTLGLFKPGMPEVVIGETLGPELSCPPPGPDANGDGVVDAFDLAALLASWGPCPCCPTDVNGDGTVNATDLAQMLGSWGPLE